MAEIIAKFNTNEKTLSVTIDGKAVADVACVEFGKSYRDDDDFMCSLVTSSRDEEHDTMNMTRLVASQSLEGKAVAAKASEAKSWAGFLVVPPKSRVQSDIEKFFGME